MRSKDKKKLWFHTGIFILLIFSILLVFGFFEKSPTQWIRKIGIIVGSIIFSIVCTIYPWFMIKWFRKNKEENKPGAWDYLIDRWFWKGLFFGIIFSIITVILLIGSVWDFVKRF